MSWLTTEAGIIGDAIGGKISWGDAAAKSEALGQKIEKALGPAVQAAAGATVTIVKQDVSDAIGIGDSLMAPALTVAAKAAEGLLDGLIVEGLTPIGAATVAPALTKAANDTIDGFAKTLIAAIHARSAQIKASLAPPATA